MNARNKLVWITVVALALAGCSSSKPKPEVPPPPSRVEPAVDPRDLIRDRTVVPGVRIGPVFIGMPLRQVIELVGEPRSGTRSRIPGGRTALLYRYADPDASPDGTLSVLVREYDQTVYSIQVEKIESFQTREGVRFGSSEALVRASFGNPQSTRETGVPATEGPGTDIRRTYCYLNGLAVQMTGTGTVEGFTVFPGRDLRKICKSQ